MDPVLILDDKSKEKALAEEMKKKYDTMRGTRDIIIKWINNAATQMGTNILACKLLIKCRKDEVPEGVIVVATQCIEGHLHELGALSVKLIPSGLQGRARTRYRVSLLMAAHPYSFHGMAGTRVCSFFY
jgi:hypothetical protein